MENNQPGNQQEMEYEFVAPEFTQPGLAGPPQETARKAAKLSGREIGILAASGVLVVLLVVLLLVFVARAKRTPMQLVNQYTGAESTFNVQTEIALVSIPGNNTHFVYLYVGSTGIQCAVLERGPLGFRVVHVAGPVPVSSGGAGSPWVASMFDAASKQYIVFGALYDRDLSRVAVDGNAATVVDSGKYRCWFYVGQGDMTIGSESVKYS